MLLALLAAVQLRSPAATAASYSAPRVVVAQNQSQPVTAPPILTERQVAPAWPKTYKIRPGDSLSSIAGREYGSTKKWPSIFWQNRTIIKWANIIMAGHTLVIPDPSAASRPAPAQLGPPVPVVRASVRGGDGTSASSVHLVSSSSSSGTYHGSYSHQQCIISRESGGNSQVTNSSGHYGLYQFSESTWVGSGGSAAEFGHASVAEQNQVFANAVAARGYSDWDPYDGC
jgi:LysM repeat protein